MNKLIVADSSALVSLAIPTDSNNKKAIKISKQIEQTAHVICVPGDVFSETINVLGKKVGHKGASQIGKKVIDEEKFILRETTPRIRLVAFEKFQIQPKDVSFTDCLVMAFADEFETKKIFGFDESFRKNGYIRAGIDKE